MNEKLVENPFKNDDNFDEAIPIQMRKERTTEAYKYNTNKDICMLLLFFLFSFGLDIGDTRDRKSVVYHQCIGHW